MREVLKESHQADICDGGGQRFLTSHINKCYFIAGELLDENVGEYLVLIMMEIN